MRNIMPLIAIAALLGFAMMKGKTVTPSPVRTVVTPMPDVPHLGRIQVLNGCGKPGVARLMADHLRSRNFDVKHIGNADNWNFPQTLVLSRTPDTTIAAQVAASLNSRNMLLLRNREHRYDVTVIIGSDYGARLQ